MRGIDLLPPSERVSGRTLTYRVWAVNASITAILTATVLAVAAFLLNLYYQGSVRKLQDIISGKKQEIQTLSGIESLQTALKTRASAVATLGKKRNDYQPALTAMISLVGNDGRVQDVALDGAKVTASIAIVSTDSLISIINRLTGSQERFRNVVLTSIVRVETGGWQLSMTAEFVP